MTATVEQADTGVVLRDIGEHGTVEYVEVPRRAYHLVTPDGKRKRMPSVTTILGCLEKRALYAWHEAKGCEGTVLAIRAGELDPLTCEPSEAVETVRALDLGAQQAKQDAADRGLDVHGALEHYCQTGELPDTRELMIDARPYLTGLAKWLLAYDPVPVHTERIVCHPELHFAGRYDLWCEISGLSTLLDLKTSRTGRPWPEAHLQLRAYVDAEVAVGEPEPAQIVALGISPDGDYCHEPCVAPPGSFDRVLAVYRLRAQLDKDLRAARKAVEV